VPNKEVYIEEDLSFHYSVFFPFFFMQNLVSFYHTTLLPVITTSCPSISLSLYLYLPSSLSPSHISSLFTSLSSLSYLSLSCYPRPCLLVSSLKPALIPSPPITYIYIFLPCQDTKDVNLKPYTNKQNILKSLRTLLRNMTHSLEENNPSILQHIRLIDKYITILVYDTN
jgi:hypothetical protein